ncbi:hypothetical protein C5S39_01215 [Candidatus Methanophagaceae archaeon]|nr:hypothetical protein C5S39_01215 [Methanophagales archaeon]
MNLFNNREIATAIWLLVIFILMLFNMYLRKSILDVFKAFFKIEILSLIFFMIAYTAGIVFILYQINCWNISLLKDTVVWFCFTAIVVFVDSVTSEKDQNIFKNIIVKTIKVVLIYELVANTYTFSLVGELILVPLVSFIVILKIHTERDENNKSFVKLLNGVLLIIGIIIFYNFISNVVSDYNNFVSVDTLRKFLLPPLLTFLLSPFIYFVVLFSTYNQLFKQLNSNSGHKKTKKLKRYAKIKAIKHCFLNLKKVNSLKLIHIKNEEDVDNMIKYSRL